MRLSKDSFWIVLSLVSIIRGWELCKVLYDVSCNCGLNCHILKNSLIIVFHRYSEMVEKMWPNFLKGHFFRKTVSIKILPSLKYIIEYHMNIVNRIPRVEWCSFKVSIEGVVAWEKQIIVTRSGFWEYAQKTFSEKQSFW